MHVSSKSFSPAALVCVLLVVLSRPAFAQRDDYSGPPINYETAPVNDPVAQLSRQLEAGEAQLQYDEEHGYLKSLLKELDVPVSSQTLVFSKTSMQQHRISSRTPRALYFNDDVYVGFCQQGEVIEIATTDATQGAIFYTLDQTKELTPAFVRDRGQCLTCHSSHRTQNVPGYVIRSVFAKAGGQPEFGRGTFTTDQTSPFTERWGGWYVTGTHGDLRHMGNAIYKAGEEDLDRETFANLTSLKNLVATDPYLTPHSDIVALMVLEHQTQMHNAIAWANYETRRAVHQSQVMNKILEREPDYISDTSQRRIAAAAEQVLEYLLFCEEFRLTSPVTGSSNYTTEFSSRGPRDKQGRSLRDLDLKTRLLRYPCSYLIYSDAFGHLPDIVRTRILSRLKEILSGEDDSEKFQHLTPTDRKAIQEILLETKPEFAAL